MNRTDLTVTDKHQTKALLQQIKVSDIRPTVCQFAITDILLGDGNAIRSCVTHKGLLDRRRLAV